MAALACHPSLCRSLRRSAREVGPLQHNSATLLQLRRQLIGRPDLAASQMRNAHVGEISAINGLIDDPIGEAGAEAVYRIAVATISLERGEQRVLTGYI